MKLFEPTFFKRVLFFILGDVILFYISLSLAYGLRFEFQGDVVYMQTFAQVFIVLTSIKIFSLLSLNAYNITWRYFSLHDLKKIIYAHILAIFSFYGIFILFNDFFTPMPRSVILMDFFLSLILIGFLRISKRIFLEQNLKNTAIRTVVIGANNKTNSIIQSAFNKDIDYKPLAIIAITNEEKNLIGSSMHDLKVFSSDDIEKVIESKEIESAIITSDLPPETLNVLYERLSLSGIKGVKLAKLLGSQYDKLQALSIEDLLARHPQDLDPKSIASFIKGKKVLITGAGGSIGSEIARQCSHFDAISLLLVDHAEYNLYKIKEELPNSLTKMISVVNKDELDKVFELYKPDIVIHAAAYKHVPLCEDNVDSALRNNILGTMNVVDLSILHQVQKLVIISTDKAVRPTNVMGATKRVTELYAQNIDAKETEIVAVRFGNVLGSSGSVIPKFKYQIEHGGPVTVTDAEMTRYFMLIPEACQLVLQAASIAKGNELFILDMGEPVKIVDLAKKMIQLYGKEDKVNITYTGLRPGEKLYEELMLDKSEQKTKYESIFITKPTLYNIDNLKKDIEELFVAENKIKALQKIVPEFERKV